MENLRKTIEILFCKTNPEVVIQNIYNWKATDLSKHIQKENFTNIAETIDTLHSKYELESIYEMANTNWCYSPEKYPYSTNERSNVFYTLLSFSKEILMEENEHPVCEFAQLLKWRDLTLKLGEDLFTTSFFAYRDLSSKRNRHYFAWSPTIGNNNHHLKEITRKGLTDLHFHLFGSSLNFDITWLSLMNDICNRKKDFEAIKKSKSPDANIYESEPHLSLYGLYVKAFAIRLILFRTIIKDIPHTKEDTVKTNEDYYLSILKSRTEEELRIYVPFLQEEANIVKSLYGKKYNKECVDYAIRINLSEKNYEENSFLNIILTGERWMMYKLFSKIFSEQKNTFQIRPLFYTYLIIKSRLRRELIQVNNHPGFYNFQEYQKRKLIFIRTGSIYERLIVNLSVTNMLYNQDVTYMEARVAPLNTASENRKFIKSLDQAIHLPEFRTPSQSLKNKFTISNTSEKDHTHRYHYIFHFLKQNIYPDQNYKSITTLANPRHHNLRKLIKTQAKAINSIRKFSISVSNRIVGIDAAGTEIGFRPEIFAQGYRYLKFYSYENNDYILNANNRNPLGFTYHVGEDFLDIADGLRAIDETIRFLNFKRGDRIGHGLALGINPEMFYRKKNFHIILSKLDFLDNIVWLLTQIRKYNLTTSQALVLQLTENYWKILYDIYNQQICTGKECQPEYKKQEINITSIQPDVYYQSWLLRGDDPKLYFNSDVLASQKAFNPITFWDKCGLNEGEEYAIARNNIVARALYKAYHFSQTVKLEGAKVDEFTVSPEYIQLIQNIQKAMRVELSEKHIAVEINPTSNKLIGAYALYAEHPITNFYNLGLVNDNQKIEDCPQLSISINTDDLGVFATNLENEYALIAIALEKEKKENGSPKYASRLIYNWLETIRQMGFEQRFIKTVPHNGNE